MIGPRWHPVVTADSIENAGTYEYGATVLGGRLWCCCGLGTDTIVNVTLDGSSRSLVPFKRLHQLVADPAVIATAQGLQMFCTLGDADGKNNGIIRVSLDSNGSVIVGSSATIVMPQATPDSYGTGQPSVADSGNGFVMAVRQDRPGGGDQVCLYQLDEQLMPAEQIEFTEVEDGASPELFWYQGKPHIIFAGGGWIGVRSYEWVDPRPRRLRREREHETAFPLPDGSGSFMARTAVFAGDTIDGIGVVRDSANRVIVGYDGSLTVWRAAGKASDPGTWGLRKLRVPLP